MKLFVWDFHGTLEEGNEFAVGEISNEVLQQFGYAERFTHEDCLRLYGSHWYEYFADLLPQESYERHMELQSACFVMSNSQPEIVARHIQPSAHAHEVLQAIDQSHHAQVVISNTIPESLTMFLEAVEMQRFFSAEYALAASGHSKQAKKVKHHLLQQFLQQKQFQEIVIIGNSPKDMELTEVAGGIRYLYAHAGKPLRDCPADHKIQDLRKVLQEL